MSIKVKNGSSIYKLATWWGTEQLPKNMCSLVWRTIFSFIITSALVVALSIFLSHLLAGIAASVAVGKVIWTFHISLVVTISVTLLLVILYCLMYDNIEKNKNGTLANVSKAYYGWKNKYCPTVEECE